MLIQESHVDVKTTANGKDSIMRMNDPSSLHAAESLY